MARAEPPFREIACAVIGRAAYSGVSSRLKRAPRIVVAKFGLPFAAANRAPNAQRGNCSPDTMCPGRSGRRPPPCAKRRRKPGGHQFVGKDALWRAERADWFCHFPPIDSRRLETKVGLAAHVHCDVPLLSRGPVDRLLFRLPAASSAPQAFPSEMLGPRRGFLARDARDPSQCRPRAHSEGLRPPTANLGSRGAKNAVLAGERPDDLRAHNRPERGVEVRNPEAPRPAT